jgi:hypothetical protein
MSTQKPTNTTGQRSRVKRWMPLPLLVLALTLGASNAFALLGITCTTPSLGIPANGSSNVGLNPALTWSGGLLSLGATYNVYFGPGTTAAQLPATPVTTTSGQSWAPPTLTPGTSYVWKIAPSCLLNLASDPVATFTTTCPPPPTPTISGPSSFFAGNKITLTSSSATGNLWSTGSTTQSIIVSAAGSYTVKVTNPAGCAATSAPSAVTALAPVSLGSASGFAVLGGTTVTNTGSSVITGDLGVSPGTSVTGFPPGVITGGPIHAADAVASQAQSDLTTAYTVAAATPCAADLSGADLGGLTLQPGVYCFSSSAQLTGTLTLDFMGNQDSSFLFKIGSTLTTASASSVIPINSAGATRPSNIFWQVGSSATLGTGSSFLGNILALTSITLNTGAQVSGRALARNGAVTLDTNVAAICAAPATPTISGPSSFCAPGSITLTSSYATGNLWSTGALTQSITVSTAGSYTVTVTNAAGCSATSAPDTVSAIPAPAAASLLVPSDGAMLTTTPTLTWSASSGATYQLNLTGTTLAPGTGTSFTPSSLAPGTYTWSVNTLGCGGTVPGASRTFTIFAADFTSTSVTAGTATAFSAGVNPATVPLDTWVWNLGDGSVPQTTRVPSTTYTYPTSGTYLATLTATTAAGVASVSTHPVTVTCPTIAITPSALPSPTIGISYRQPLSAIGGATPYRFQVVSGSLPVGFALSASGNVNGDPSVTGISVFSIQVTDKNGCTVTQSYSLEVIAACSTVAPTLFQPLDNASRAAGPVTFGWTPVAGATSYQVHVNLIGSVEGAPVQTTATSLTINELPGTFEWYVAAASSVNCAPVESLHRTLIVSAAATSCPAAGPTLTAPADGLSVQAGTVTLAWAAVPFATSYSVFVSTAGTTPITTTTTNSAVDVPAGTNVTWYVVATSAGCPDQSSLIQNFTTPAATATCPTAAPDLQSPIDGASADTARPVTFTWTAVTGAASYNLLLSTDGTNFTATSVAGATSSLTLPAGAYTWQVEAVFPQACPTTRSPLSHFNAAAVAITCPTISIGPAALPFATVGIGYQQALSAFGGVAPYTFNVVNGPLPAGFVLLPDGNLNGNPLIPGTSVFSIQVTDQNGCSRTQSFSIAVNCSTVAPTLLAPPDNAQNLGSPLTFSWTPVPGATAYNVYVALEGTLANTPVQTTATSLTISALPGTFEWYVVASSDTCPSLESLHRTIAIAATCDDKAPTPLSPSNGATTTPGLMQFSWSAVSKAIGYRLFLSVNGAPFAAAVTTTDTSIAQSIPEGVINWYVTAQFTACPEVQSKTFTLTAKKAVDCPTGTISLATPANGSNLSTPITFSWTPLPGSQSYRIWISLDGGSPSVLATTSSASTTAPMSSGSVEWYVEALFDQCPSITSAHGTFTVARKLDCGGNARPSLTSPADKATGVPTPVDFAWTAVPAATSYRLWATIGGAGAADLGTTTDTHLSLDMTTGSIEWYVETFFDGCPSTLSQHSRFTTTTTTSSQCSNAAPATISPADGSAATASPVTFIWTSVPGAAGYRLHAGLDDSELAVIGTTTNETSFTTQIPPGAVTWFVEAIFDGCSSTSSQRARFSVPRDVSCSTTASSPQSPANGSNLTDSAVTFVWTPVSGAIGYELWARSSDGSASSIGSTRSETQLTKHMPKTTIDWFVRTLFNGCPSTDSQHATFTIAQTPSCDHQRPLLLSPPDDASDLPSQIAFSWTAVPGATSYQLWLANGEGQPAVIAMSATATVTAGVPTGHNHWHIEALFNGCSSLESADSSFDVAGTGPACLSPARPVAEVIGQVQSGGGYTVRWSPVANATLYELQEAASNDFSGATTSAVAGLSSAFSKEASQTSTVFYYRVRAVSSCSDERGPFSEAIAIAIVPLPSTAQKSLSGSTEVGEVRSVVQKLFLPGSGSPVSFTATVDEPWLSVAPASGTIPAEGITLLVSSDPSTLPIGTNTGTVVVITNASGKGAGLSASGMKTGTNGAPPSSSVPISVSVVTPVSPTSHNTPLPESLIIPSVGHADGANNSKFQSDVRVTNTSTQVMKYQINFTPTGPGGTTAMKQTIIQINPGATTALDDILSSFFGVGASAANASAAGVLEIRPLTATTSAISSTPSISSITVASSRTYNVTASGATYGQYIPAVPFAQFVGKSLDPLKPNVLSIQQISQSRDFTSGYRTNIGLLEAAGQPADLNVSVFGKDGGLLGSFPVSLAAGEHRQIGGFLAAHDIYADDARIEVQVTSDTGKVSAYASVIDNRTNDPLLVYPVLKGAASATRFILPGAANLNTGSQSWRTDMRIFNPSTERSDITLTYLPQRGETTQSRTATLSVLPGETKNLDGMVLGLFGLSGITGGAVHVTTAASSSLIVSGRTYTDDSVSGGTYGQFIPAVTAAQSIGLKDRALQVLQLEQSSRFRTNLGIAETAGKPVTVEVSLVLPDTKVTPTVRITLQPYEFLQAPIISSLGITTAYNARVALRVVDGDGKVTAYGSVIDQVTGDPTYVPAQ